VYATSTQEQDLLRDVATQVSEEKLMENLVTSRAAVYTAQLAFGRALALVRLTSPPKVVNAAEAYLEAVQAFEDETREKGGIVLQRRIVGDGDASNPVGVVGPQTRLVNVTRKVTGYGPTT
jgi:hypothetical protein